MPTDAAAHPYGNPTTAKVLLIGHDPRLQSSDTVAQYAFFADHYFQHDAPPTHGPAKAKYGLAKAVFDYVAWLTAGRYTPDQVLLTNLCNHALPHAPKGKTVYIPESAAREGLTSIRSLLAQGSVEVIFATSNQVTYWLGQLGFFDPGSDFLRAAAPQPKGVANDPPYYAQSKSRSFTLVCGKRFVADGRWTLVPVVHVKNWPLTGRFTKAYGQALEGVRTSFA